MFTAESRTREEMCVTDNKPTSITRNGNYYVYANGAMRFFSSKLLMCVHLAGARKEHKTSYIQKKNTHAAGRTQKKSKI